MDCKAFFDKSLRQEVTEIEAAIAFAIHGQLFAYS